MKEEFVSKMTTLELEVEELKAENKRQQSLIEKLTANSIHSTVYGNNIIELQSNPAAVTGMPKSCADLRYLGHAASGLYLIAGTEKVETVYCDFTALPSDPSRIFFCIWQTYRQIIKLMSTRYRLPDVDRAS